MNIFTTELHGGKTYFYILLISIISLTRTSLTTRTIKNKVRGFRGFSRIKQDFVTNIRNVQCNMLRFTLFVIFTSTCIIKQKAALQLISLAIVQKQYFRIFISRRYRERKDAMNFYFYLIRLFKFYLNPRIFNPRRRNFIIDYFS